MELTLNREEAEAALMEWVAAKWPDTFTKCKFDYTVTVKFSDEKEKAE